MRRRRRRLPRILLNATTAASLVLCVATMVEWARSYRRTTTFNRCSRAYDGAARYEWQCTFRPGRLTLSYGMQAHGGPAEVTYEIVDEPPGQYDPGWDVDSTHLGFGWCWYQSPPEMVDQFCRAVSIPYWALAVVFSIWPVLPPRRWNRVGQDDQSLCST
jgi:hypothetical protein